MFFWCHLIDPKFFVMIVSQIKKVMWQESKIKSYFFYLTSFKRLGQKSWKKIVGFFGRSFDTKRTFWNQLTFSNRRFFCTVFKVRSLVWLEANEAFDQDIRVCGFYEKIKECNITFEPELNMQWSNKNKTERKKVYPWLRASQLYIILMRQQNLELVSKNGYGSQSKKVFLKETPLRALYDNFWIFDPIP